MHTSVDKLNNLAVIAIVGAAWLSGKIQEITAIPVLLALAGLIALPNTLAARAIATSHSSDKNKAVKAPFPPDATLMLLASGATLSMVAKYIQAFALASVVVGFSACGVDYSSIVQRTGHGLAAMHEAYDAACNEGLDTSEACRKWGKAYNDLQQVYSEVNDALKDDADGGAE